MGNRMTLRKAELSDAELLLDWRNDPVTRQASHHTGEIRFEEHRSWLAKSLADPNRKLLIAEINGRPVGTIRADLENGEWLLSWNVAPSERGSGLGRQIVSAFTASIKEPVRAEVKSGNIPSVRIATAAGMTVIREHDGVLHFFRAALETR